MDSENSISHSLNSPTDLRMSVNFFPAPSEMTIESEDEGSIVKQPEVKRSYACHIESINEFLQNKARQRCDSLNKTRPLFGIYADCAGLIKQPVYFSKREKGALSLRYSPDGNHVVAGFGSGTVNLYNAKMFSLTKTVVYGKEIGCAITCVRFMTDSSNIFYASSAEGFVLCYDILNDNLFISISEPKCEINAIDINCDNTYLATGGSDHSIKVYDQNKLLLLSSYKREKFGVCNYNFSDYHTNRVYAVKFLPDDPNTFLSGGWDNMLKLWDLRTPNGCVNSVLGPHISGDAIDVRGNVVLTGSWIDKDILTTRDLRTLTILKNVVPINSQKLIEGVYTFATRFLDSDKSGDVILRASLGYKSVDVISISQSVLLHSFVCEQSCVSIDTQGSNLIFGGTHNAFNFGVFFMNLYIPYHIKAGISLEEDVEEEEEITQG